MDFTLHYLIALIIPLPPSPTQESLQRYNNIALAERELGLIGHIWRNPDDVVPAEDGHWMLVKRAAGGGLYRLVVSAYPNGGLVFHTFYKTKK